MDQAQGRIRYLDGLRGLSILLVLIWHFYGPTYASYLPFGNRYGHLPIVRDGWVGVNMFFLISGYVIFVTLERCNGFADFIIRRWLRLFPAMLLISALIFLFDHSTHLTAPYSGSKWADFLPGLSFISPSFWHALFHIDLRSMDGVFWSLYVEVAFYVIFGLLYFGFGTRVAIAGLLALNIVTLSGRTVLSATGATPLVARSIEPFEWLGFNLFSWFASGALFASAGKSKSRLTFLLAIASGIFAALVFNSQFPLLLSNRIMLLSVVLIFAAAQRSPIVQKILTSKILIFLGFISYPLYLLHNDIGIALIAFASSVFPAIPVSILPPLIAVIVVGIAWIVARHIEPRLSIILVTIGRWLRGAGQLVKK